MSLLQPPHTSHLMAQGQTPNKQSCPLLTPPHRLSPPSPHLLGLLLGTQLPCPFNKRLLTTSLLGCIGDKNPQNSRKELVGGRRRPTQGKKPTEGSIRAPRARWRRATDTHTPPQPTPLSSVPDNAQGLSATYPPPYPALCDALSYQPPALLGQPFRRRDSPCSPWASIPPRPRP